MKLYLILILLLCSSWLNAQIQDSCSYLIENYAYFQESKDTASWFQYKLAITKVKESKNRIILKLSVHQLEQSSRDYYRFLKDIEDLVIEVSFNKKKGFITVLDFDDMSQIKQQNSMHNQISITCVYKDSQVYIQNHINANMFYLGMLLNKNISNKKMIRYTKEGTELEYRLSNDVGEDRLKTNYILEESSHEDYCFNIFDCHSIRVNDKYKFHLSLINDKYNKLEPSVKRKMTRREHYSATRDFHYRQTKSTLSHYENSYDTCLYEQDNLMLSIEIKNLEQQGEEIFIKRDDVIFPIYWGRPFKKIIRNVNIKKLTDDKNWPILNVK